MLWCGIPYGADDILCADPKSGKSLYWVFALTGRYEYINVSGLVVLLQV